MEKEQKEREVAELQTRLSLEEQREEEKGKEAFTLKQKLTEAETARDSLKKEVRIEDSEERFPVFSLCCGLDCFMIFLQLFNVAFPRSKTPGGVGGGLAGL